MKKHLLVIIVGFDLKHQTFNTVVEIIKGKRINLKKLEFSVRFITAEEHTITTCSEVEKNVAAVPHERLLIINKVGSTDDFTATCGLKLNKHTPTVILGPSVTLYNDDLTAEYNLIQYAVDYLIALKQGVQMINELPDRDDEHIHAVVAEVYHQLSVSEAGQEVDAMFK